MRHYCDHRRHASSSSVDDGCCGLFLYLQKVAGDLDLSLETDVGWEVVVVVD